MLPNEKQTLQVIPCEKSRDEARIFCADIPEKNILAIRHESERDE